MALSSPKKSKSKFQYKKRSVEDVKQHAAQSSSNFDSIYCKRVDEFTAKEGNNTIRFLPPTWGDHRHYGYEVWVHGYVGQNSGSYLCLQKMKKLDCPICEFAKQMKDSGEEPEEYKKIEAKKRYICYILNRNGDDPLKPILYNMSWTMDRDITTLAIDPDDGSVLYLDHPEEGHDVHFNRKGKGLNTDYVGIRISTKPSPIAKNERDKDEILETIEASPIPPLLKFYDYDYLENVMTGKKINKDPDLDDEDEEEVRPRRKSASKRPDLDEDEDDAPPRRRKVPHEDEDEEDEDEDNEEEDEDEEEDEAPRRSKKAAAKKPVAKKKRVVDEDDEEDEEDEDEEEDEEEEDEEEEDEEEERPRSKKKTPPAKKKVAAKKKRVVEEEDEDEEEEEEEDEDEDEDEEEEETPRRNTKAKRTTRR